MAINVRRRELIIGAAAAACPRLGHAQHSDGMRRIGFLAGTENDTDAQRRVTAFQKELEQRGWIIGRNVQIDYRWAAGDSSRIKAYAKELVGLAPDLILATAPPILRALLEETHTVPIVFFGVADPIGAGFVESLAKPGGNITGFTNFEFSIAGKWGELIKEIAPATVNIAILHNPTNPTAAGYLGVLDTVAPSLQVQLTRISARDGAEIEAAIVAASHNSSTGLIVLPEVTTTAHHKLIVALAAGHRLPAVYPGRFFVDSGGLISYGPDYDEQYRQAASYVDRIFKGEKPGNLPIQAPTKLVLAINLKTAKTLGLNVPLHLQQVADAVIE